MDSYAINVLSSSRLFECRLTEPMISIIGKWLINNPPEHGANRLARRVLSGLHWGLGPDGQNLWIDVDVHAIAADTVVKAHSVHCSRSNSMISKSISKISKLASKVGDAESLFQQFCWDLLVKLKLPTIPVDLVQNDLTAHYVRIVQNYEDDVVVYLEKAVPLLSDLVSSGSSVASVVLLSRLIAQHYQKVNLMAADKNFMATFERLLHIDQLPYAVQWLSGPSSTPTPIVRLICSAISYYSAKLPPRDYLRAWITLLCQARTGWNEDAVTYQIVGTIARIAFINDTQKLYEITSIVFQAYQQQMAAEKNQSKGILALFSSDSSASPLIPDSMLAVSPFASYIMLRVEQKSFNPFYGHFYETLGKKDKYNLDHAAKKAASKCSMALPVERLAVFRWAKLVTVCKDSALLPIILQQLAGQAYRLRKANNLNLCYARRLIDEPQMQDVMAECRKAIEETTVATKGLSKAVVGWLFTKHEVTRTGFDFSVFDLDYLLQLILAGDKNMWMDFVNMPHFTSEEFAERKLYSVTCQLSPKNRESPSPPELGSPRARGTAKPFPVLPVHSGLPKAPCLDPSTIFQQHVVLQMAAPFMSTVKNLAKQYTECGDRMGIDDDAYCKLIRILYQSTQQTVPVEIRCSYCSKPKPCTMTVKPNVLSPEIDVKMSQNRQKRIEFWNELNASMIDQAAVATASMEHLSRLVSMMAAALDPRNRNSVQPTGHSLFYLITSSVGENELLFSVASESYSHSLRALGEEFVKFRPEEQMDVMQLALNGFVLSEPLVEVFTPEVLNSDDLCTAYRKLSDAVRMPERSKMALQLLGRLGMQQAAAGLPPHQFAALLPIAFANLASQPDPSSPLHSLCLQHVLFFVFHHFPDNIVNGLDLALEGCNTNSTPASLLDAIVDKLEATDYLKKKSSFDLGAAKADECASVLSKRLDEARTKLPNFYGIWSRYLDSITRLAQLFLFVPIRDGYEPNQAVSILQRECYEYFARVAAVFSPLIAPYSPTHPPFSPSHETQAMLVLDRFVEFLSALHYNSSIPPGMQNIQSLVWQFYCEKLSMLTHGTEHYYGVIERQLVRLNWQALWPSRLAITAMETCLDTRSKDCASFVSQIVVRIPWNSILQTMHEDSRTSYMASLFGVLVRLASRAGNYDKVRASLLELTKSLSLRQDWNIISLEDASNIAMAVTKSLPSDSLSHPIEIVSVIQVIWRKICCFVAREPYSEVSLQKQKLWMQTECALLLKADSTQIPAAYNSLVSDVNALAVNHSNLREFRVVTRELTAMWKNITDTKLGESLVRLWTEYLLTNPSSPLVLTSVNTVIDSLNADQLTTALKVIEKIIRAYFLRTDSNWTELMHWIQFPNGSLKSIKSYLMTVPSSENKVQMLPLTLRVFMDYGGSDDNKFFDLHYYVVSIRPKHVTSEPGFMCLLARLIQWIAHRSPTLPAHFAPTDDLLPPLIRFLGKASKDESSFLTALISSKKTSHSPKMRVVLQILELYLTQQTLGEGKRPRCDANSPVLNSRITTLKDLAQQKSNQNMSNTFNKATAYFVQIDTYHIGSSSKLLLEIGRAAFGDRFLSDV
ncbi:hypothetical protein L5515_013698 [Caenorhabditis briggsae]|uniref:Uncharacterized protein n=1 Tax=Caenorhabditis briggsae TaxID=6238 RepID=A0AAE9EBC5_CAEBR|nr:hypothetical protein L5515_013698 [Caenorhabditis briggsae]